MATPVTQSHGLANGAAETLHLAAVPSIEAVHPAGVAAIGAVPVGHLLRLELGEVRQPPPGRLKRRALRPRILRPREDRLRTHVGELVELLRVHGAGMRTSGHGLPVLHGSPQHLHVGSDFGKHVIHATELLFDLGQPLLVLIDGTPLLGDL